MKILIMDHQASSLDWAIRCMADGHKVKWYCSNIPRLAEVGKGIVDRIDDPYDWYKWADLIFFTDNVKWLNLADAWKKQGWPVIAPSIEAADWELDRGVGQDVLKKAGVEIAPVQEFTDYDTAISFVKRTMERYVSKPSDDADKSLSYCSKSPADMVYMLERWKKLNKLKTPFILQKFIGGTEMAVGGWFGPGGFNRGWCENWEFKKLMNDDLGVATGEQGTVLRYVKSSKLADMVLKPAESALEKLGYVGYVDVNCIIDDEGTPWPLEFTMRPGWPTFNIQQALHKGDHAEWLMDLWEGKDAKNWELDKVAMGVVLSIPDYPYSHLTKKEVSGVPIYCGEKAMNCLSMPLSIHLCEAKMGEAPHQVGEKIITQPCIVTAGDYILVASGTGATVSEAKKESYKALKTVSLPNSPMYRTDIGNRLKKQIPELNRLGFATNLVFNRVYTKSLKVREEILDLPTPHYADETYIDILRLKESAAASTLNMGIKVDENRLRHKQTDVVSKLYEEIKREKEAKIISNS